MKTLVYTYCFRGGDIRNSKKCANPYSYDVHGDVTTLLQDHHSLASIGQRFKRLDYDYDQISGKVNDVHYQNGQADAFHHHYEYDAENRLTHIYTSRFPTAYWAGYKDAFWDNDANYYYYLHGPVARVEIGDNKLQGIDYAYTLEGWLKGTNSEALQPKYDMGKDGLYASANPNKTFGKDVFGYSLTYFTGDYNAIYNGWKTDSTNRFTASQYLNSHAASDLPAHRFDMYNGNIGTMVTSITNPGLNTSMPIAGSYKYDQLNRIIQSQSYQELQGVTNNWNNENSANSSLKPAYYNAFSYDGMGNIISQLRKDVNGTSIDSLTYNYAHDSNNELFQNRLYSVNDNVPNARFNDDIDDQGTFHPILENINGDNNYSYDELGELKKDSAEQIQQINWTLHNRLKSISRYPSSSKQNFVFDYDAQQNRIAKHVYTSANVWIKSTYYVRDADGHVMTTYEEKSNGSILSYRVKEHDIYGSKRLGVVVDSTQLIGATPDTINYSRILGQKEFEMTNHLGNIITVISDRKVAQDPTAPLSVYNSPNFVRTTIDSLGGMKMQPLQQNGGVNFSFKSVVGQNYKVDFYVGMANTNSSDMLQFAYPSNSGVGLTGTGHYTFSFSATDTISSFKPFYNATGNTPNDYFLFDSLKVVATGITLDTIISYNPQLISVSDYYGFGTLMPGRQYTLSGQYRYGFNGKEKDDDVKGTGDSYDYGLRIYDPRLGRFLSVDPLAKTYPYKTPYDFAENDVIRASDLDGAEKNMNTLNLPERTKYLGTPNQDFGFGDSNAPTASNNGGVIPGEPYGKKYYFNPNANTGSTGHYFWQSPVTRITSVNQVNTPPAVNTPAANNINANIGFNTNSPQLTTTGQAQVNNIAQQVVNRVTQTQGPVTTQVQTQTNTNAEGLPRTVVTTTQSQPVQIVTVTSNVVISLATGASQNGQLSNGLTGQQLLNQRYANIRKQLIDQGVPAANISRGATRYGVRNLTNGNQTTFNIQSNTATQAGNRVNTNTTTTEKTYGK